MHRLLSASRAAYEVAGERARNAELRGLLFSLSSGRLLMLRELEGELERLKGMKPLERSLRLREAIKRKWMTVCAVLTVAGDRELLRECERGERYTVDLLRALLQLPELRNGTREMLRRMEQDIARNLDDIFLLESGSLGFA